MIFLLSGNIDVIAGLPADDVGGTSEVSLYNSPCAFYWLYITIITVLILNMIPV